MIKSLLILLLLATAVAQEKKLEKSPAPKADSQKAVKLPTDKSKAGKKAPKNENLEVTSQNLDYNHAERIAIFQLDVKAINGPTVMTADKMICHFDEKNDPYLIIAEGKVTITKGDKVAKAEKAVYKLNEQIIILRRSPELFDGNNTIKARIITFYEAKSISEFDDPDCLFQAQPPKDKKKTTPTKKPGKKPAIKALPKK